MVSGGGLASAGQAIVSNDGKNIFLPNGDTVKVYDAQSGKRTGVLRGHTDTVTGIALHPHNSFQVFSVSRDGTVKLWDFSDGICAKQIDTGKPILSLIAPYRQDLLYLQQELKVEGKETGSQTGKIDLASWQLKPETLKTKSFSALAASSDGELIGIAHGHSLTIWQSSKGWKHALKLHHTKAFTCLAIENTEGRVAGGDVSGRILIWHNLKAGLANVLDGKDPNMNCTTLHWHAHPLQSLAFSFDKAYLLSGGSEAVLVAWQLGTNAKRLLPRLSACILGITPFRNDHGLYLVTQKDNSVRRINLASMKVELSLSGIRPAAKPLPDQSIDSSATIAMLPGGGELVIAGENSVIQFYDPVKDRHLDKLQVKPVNVVAPMHNQSSNSSDWSDIEPQVTNIAFNHDGSYMATTDVKADTSTTTSYSVSLKFWERRVSGSQASTNPLYEVRSQIDDPHRAKITGVAFHPTESLSASISIDGNMHLWRAMQLEKSLQWRCVDTLSYQGRSMSSIAFSADGSLLAVGCGPSIVLWNPNTGMLVDVLECSLGGPSCIEHITFVPGTPYLVGATNGSKNYFTVWNLLLKAVWWAQQVSVTCLTADGLGTGHFAVGLKPLGGLQKPNSSGFAVLFNVISPKPEQIWLLPNTTASALFFPPPTSQIFASGSALSPKGSNPLLIFTADRDFTIGARLGMKATEAAIEDVEMTNVSEDGGLAVLSTFAKKPAVTKLSPAEITSQHNLDTKTKVAMLFDAPTHILPSIETLAPAFLEMLTCGYESTQ